MIMHAGTPRFLATLLLTTVAVLLHVPAGARGGLIGLIQNNVLGSPQFHKQQSWPFDPSVSARRAPEFIALHGDKSERLIERIGLGMDGRQNERREQQAVRDYLYDREQQNIAANVVSAGDSGFRQQTLYPSRPPPVLYAGR